MKNRHIPLLLLLLCIPAQAALAQEKFTLDSALALALQNSPDYFAIARERAYRDAESYDAEQFKNPELELNTTLLEKNDSTGISAELTFPLKPSQFGSRQSMARAIRDISSLEERMRTLSLKHRVTEAYLDLWIVQEHKEFLEENLKFARSTNKTVSNAASRGEVGKAASILFKAEVLQYEDELLELDAQEKAAQIRLFKLINAPLQITRLQDPQLGLLPETIQQEGLGLPRDILATRARIADIQVQVARQDSSFPEFSPRLTFSEGFDNDSRAAGIGVRLQLPFGSPSKGELTRARAEQSYAAASLKAYDTLGYESLLQKGLGNAQLMQNRTKRYENEIIPAFEDSFQAMQRMFKNGQASVIELWQFHERLHEAELKRLEVFENAFIAEMELEALMGTALNASAGE